MYGNHQIMRRRKEDLKNKLLYYQKCIWDSKAIQLSNVANGTRLMNTYIGVLLINIVQSVCIVSLLTYFK